MRLNDDVFFEISVDLKTNSKVGILREAASPKLTTISVVICRGETTRVWRRVKTKQHMDRGSRVRLSSSSLLMVVPQQSINPKIRFVVSSIVSKSRSLIR